MTKMKMRVIIVSSVNEHTATQLKISLLGCNTDFQGKELIISSCCRIKSRVLRVGADAKESDCRDRSSWPGLLFTLTMET
jgi:hypothetical protein